MLDQRDTIDRAAHFAAASIAKQPAPTPNDNPAIADLIVAELNPGHECDRRIIAAIRARQAKGIEDYGVPLQAHNGRNAWEEALQEIVDAMKYYRQAAEEAKDTGDEVWRDRALMMFEHQLIGARYHVLWFDY